MTIAIWIFFISLLFGQLGAVRLLPGVTVYMHDLTIVILLFVVFFGKRRNNIILPTFIRAILLFSFVAFISIVIHRSEWTHAEIIQSVLYLGRWIYYSLLFFAVVNSTVAVEWWLWGLYLSGVGIAMVGLGQFVFYPSLANLSYLGWDPYYYRVFSTLLDPNFTGILLVLTFFLGFYLWSHSSRPIIIASQVITLIALALTSSRSSFLALGAGVITYCLLNKQWIWILGLAVLIGVYVVIPKPTMEAFRLDRTISAFARVENWQKSILLFQKEPIFGTGFGNKRRIQSSVHVVEDIPNNAGSGIDSSLLFVLATTGIMGFFCFLYVIKNIIALIWDALRKNSSYTLGTVVLVCMIALLVHSVFTNSWFYPWVMIYVWIFLGVVQKQVSDVSHPREGGDPTMDSRSSRE